MGVSNGKNSWIKLIARPTLWPKLLASMGRPLLTRIRLRLYGAYNAVYYPADIRRLADRVIFDSTESYTKPSDDWLLKQLTESDLNDSYILSLAGVSVSMDMLQDYWKGAIQLDNIDPEVEQAAHRFHWLVQLIATEQCFETVQLSMDMVDEWLNCYQVPDSGVAWQPYTISERICNWTVFFTVLYSSRDIDHGLVLRWKSAISLHLRHLASQLEYPASGLVNNHLLNNARALYIGGCYTSDVASQELGKEIFKQYLPQMIGEGYLLEGSVHYHFLLTRTIEEVVRVAKWSTDDDFMRWMREYSSKMQTSAVRLLPPRLRDLADFPRIGDVSPDCPSDWLDLRNAGDQKGWSQVWGSFENSETNKVVSGEMDGWIVAVSDSWYSLVYCHPGINGYPEGHAHDDFGSACVYHDGVPILIDIGRFSYAVTDKVGLDGSEYHCHNTVIVDKLPILSAGRGFQGVLSAEARKNADCRLGDDRNSITWRAQTRSGVVWNRKLLLSSDDCIEILDDFLDDGKKVRSAEGYYHFAPGAEVRNHGNGNCLLSLDGLQLRIRIEGASDTLIEEVSFYPSYGQREKVYRLHWQCNIRGQHRVVLKVNQYT